MTQCQADKTATSATERGHPDQRTLTYAMSNTIVVNSPSEGDTVMSNTSAIVDEMPKGKTIIYNNSAVVNRIPKGETSSDNTSAVVGETYGGKTALILFMAC